MLSAARCCSRTMRPFTIWAPGFRPMAIDSVVWSKRSSPVRSSSTSAVRPTSQRSQGAPAKPEVSQDDYELAPGKGKVEKFKTIMNTMHHRAERAAMFDRSRIPRRTFLRGVGVAMALPWLESIPVWGVEPPKDGATGTFPRRFAALFMGNGINSEHWWAKGSGADMELGKSLQPMAPLKTKTNFITGLFNKHAT